MGIAFRRVLRCFFKRTMTQRRPLPHLLPMAAAALLATLPGWSAAETSPYYVGISQGFTADTNVFRVPDSFGKSRDLISSTGLLAGIDQPFSRMRLGAKASVNWNNFVNNKQLNNTSHDVLATLEGSTIERISGDVMLYDRANLNRYDLSAAEGASTAKDVLHVTGGALRGRVGLVTMWTLEGGYSYEQATHSLDTFSNRDVRQGAVNAGIRFAPSDLWSVRLGVRRTDGKYPRFLSSSGATVGDDFTRDDVDLSFTWVPTGNSKFDARLSNTKEEHSVQEQRDSRGWTGLVGYDWTLTGKTRMRFQFARDSGAGRSDSDLGLLTESSDTQVRDSLLWKTTWDATSKISVNSALGYSRRKLDNAFSITGGGVTATDASTARDRLTTVGLNASYEALRNLRIGCGVYYERRTVEGDNNVNTTYPYDVTTGMCNVALTLR